MIYARTIDFRAFFMMEYSMCKRTAECRAGWRASGYLVGFSETAPHVDKQLYGDRSATRERDRIRGSEY